MSAHAQVASAAMRLREYYGAPEGGVWLRATYNEAVCVEHHPRAPLPDNLPSVTCAGAKGGKITAFVLGDDLAHELGRELGASVHEVLPGVAVDQGEVRWPGHAWRHNAADEASAVRGYVAAVAACEAEDEEAERRRQAEEAERRERRRRAWAESGVPVLDDGRAWRYRLDIQKTPLAGFVREAFGPAVRDGRLDFLSMSEVPKYGQGRGAGWAHGWPEGIDTAERDVAEFVVLDFAALAGKIMAEAERHLRAVVEPKGYAVVPSPYGTLFEAHPADDAVALYRIDAVNEDEADEAKPDILELRETLVRAGARRVLDDYVAVRVRGEMPGELVYGLAEAIGCGQTIDFRAETLGRAEALPDLNGLPEVDGAGLMGRVMAADDAGYWPGVTQRAARAIEYVGGKEWLPVRGIVGNYGRENSGKTAWTVDELMQVAARHEAVVIYIALDGRVDIEVRVQLACERHADPEKGLPLFLLDPRDFDLGNTCEGWARLEARVEEFVRRCNSLYWRVRPLPVVVAVDTFSLALAGADENGRGADQFFDRACKFVTAGEKRTLVYLHHPDARGTRPRGKSNIGGVTDVLLRTVARANGISTIVAEKDRIGVRGREIARFRVAEARTADGQRTVTVAAPTAEEKKARAPVECPDDLRDAWRALDEAGASSGIEADDLGALLHRLVDAKDAKPGTVRVRKLRLKERLLAERVLVERDGVFFLADA